MAFCFCTRQEMGQTSFWKEVTSSKTMVHQPPYTSEKSLWRSTSRLWSLWISQMMASTATEMLNSYRILRMVWTVSASLPRRKALQGTPDRTTHSKLTAHLKFCVMLYFPIFLTFVCFSWSNIALKVNTKLSSFAAPASAWRPSPLPWVADNVPTLIMGIAVSNSKLVSVAYIILYRFVMLKLHCCFVLVYHQLLPFVTKVDRWW